MGMLKWIRERFKVEEKESIYMSLGDKEIELERLGFKKGGDVWVKEREKGLIKVQGNQLRKNHTREEWKRMTDRMLKGRI